MDKELRRKIREAYKSYLPILLQERPNKIDPYIFNFEIPMTPIEKNVWYEIRCLGLPFFMQVPVGPYFIDFGDPIKKIGIEADGKQWHQDIKKDESRERDLNAQGWTIYRIPGHKTFKANIDFFPDGYSGENYEQLRKEFLHESAEGILTQIKELHYSDVPKQSGRIYTMKECIDSAMEYIKSHSQTSSKIPA